MSEGGLDEIRLLGVRAHGRHGVEAHERDAGQEFVADVVMHLDVRDVRDDVTRTVHYGEVAEDVAAVLGGWPADLVETVATRVAVAVLARPAVRAVEVTVHKPQAPIPVPFDDVQVRIRRGHEELPGLTTEVVLALGANVGAPLATLRETVAVLRRHPELDVVAVSPLARTAAELAPGQDPQPDYLNAVVVARTALPPQAVLATAHELEEAHGRERGERWAPRSLDVDVVAHGNHVSTDPELTLPHPRAHERAFVLVPWAAADPAAELPGHGRVGDLAERVDRTGVRWLDPDWLARDPGDL